MRALGALERVQVGPALPHVAVRGDELLHRRALAPHLGVGTGHHDPGAALLGALGERIDDRKVRNVACVRAVYGGHMLQGVEIIAPVFRHAGGVGEVILVELFDVGRVAAEKIGVAQKGLIDRWRIAHIALTSASLQEA
jgi:hypothetical protein